MSEAWRSLAIPAGGAATPAPAGAAGQTWREKALPGGKTAERKGPLLADVLKQQFSGEGRTQYPDAPELGTSGPSFSPFSEEGLTMAGAYALNPDEKAVQDIAAETLPGAKASLDDYGNPMIELEGKKYYVNKPGLSTADLFNFSGQTAVFAPAGKYGAAGATLLKRMARTGSAAAATSVSTDLATQQMGSKQGVDYGRASMAGVGGALFEGLSPLAVKAWRGIFRRNNLFDPAKGALSEKGRVVAHEAGLDPDTMSERLAREFADEARDAVNPQQAAGRVAGKEFDIPYTKGQASRDFKQLSNEEATRHGSFGDEAGDVLREFDELQQTRMQGARSKVQSEIAGGETTIARAGQAGDAVADGVRSRAEALGRRIDAAYEATRNTEAELSAKSFRGLTRRITGTIKETHDLDATLYPNTMRAIKNLGRIERRVRSRARNGQITGVDFRKIETERRKINTLIGNAQSSDKSALTKIKAELDDWIDDAFDNQLFKGDAEALRKMQDARKLRTQYGALYEARDPGDVAGKTVAKILAREDMTPEQVINNVLGRRGLGQLDASVQILERLKKIAGEGSPDWQALREAAWLRLSKEVGSDGFSPQKFTTRLNKVMDENQSIMRTLFSDDEMNMIQRFRDDVMRTVTPAGATNPSKSGYTAARLIRETLGRLGTMFTFSGNPVGGAIFFGLKRAPSVMGHRSAKRAVQGMSRGLPRAPYFGAVGAAAIPEAAEQGGAVYNKLTD